MSYVLPPPPMVDGEVIPATLIYHQTMPGSLGECIACRGIVWSWWSDRHPSGYVGLHPRLECARKLRELWLAAIADGEADAVDAAPIVTGRANAYARRRGGVLARVSAPVAVKKAIELPPEFVPGPFWKPGYSHLVPWVLLSETSVGHVFTPFGENVGLAMKKLVEQQLRGTALYDAVVVGAALIGPDGAVARSWGEPPTPGRLRWAPINRVPEWRMCRGCDTARWPGTWMSARDGLCRACLEPGEVADPRPWPADPPDPGLMTAPMWMGGPKPVKARQREGSS